MAFVGQPSMDDDTHDSPQKLPQQVARRWAGVAELLGGCAVTLLLAVVGAFLGVVILSPLFAYLMQPPGPRGACGMWWVIPYSLSIIVGSLAGIILGLCLVWRYEALHYPCQTTRTVMVVVAVAFMVLAALAMVIGSTS